MSKELKLAFVKKFPDFSQMQTDDERLAWIGYFIQMANVLLGIAEEAAPAQRIGDTKEDR